MKLPNNSDSMTLPILLLLNIDVCACNFNAKYFILSRKEKEYEEGMNHLQKDIDQLEVERINLKENLKAHSVKKGDVKQPITFGKPKHTVSSNLNYFELFNYKIKLLLTYLFP